MNKNAIILKFPYRNKPEYIGLRILNGVVEFTFPVGYYDEKKDDLEINSLDDEYRSVIMNLLRLMSKYRESDLIDSNNACNSEFPIEAYLWIIRDYIENGYYKDLETKYNINGNGKINWKKTIKNNKLFLNNSFVYSELVTKQIKYNIENEITDIHKFCVQTAINIFGFMFGLQYKQVNNINLDEKVKLKWIQILRAELLKSFNNHKKYLLKNMIDILESVDLNGLNKKEFKLITKDFNYVFECLINEKFGTEKTSNYNPQGEWVLNNMHPFDSSDIRPDTIRIDKDNVYIIDSKYYMYGYTKLTKDLPETSSIHKQITYAQYINNLKNKFKLNNKKIYNVFILPKNSNFSNSEISYIGYARLKGHNNKEREYYYIYTFLIDLRKLIEGRLSDNCFDNIIKNTIKENIND